MKRRKNPFLCRRIWKIRCAERRGRVDRRGEKIFYQYRWKIRCAGSDTAQKAAALDIQTICPLHGPVLKENLGFISESILHGAAMSRKRTVF